MRNLYDLERHRVKKGTLVALAGSAGDELCGAFTLTSPTDGKPLGVIAAVHAGWDHVSVSRPDRCPTWQEMEHVKRRFFNADETAMQLHVPPVDHINCNPRCLHIWRPHGVDIPRPPAVLV